MHEAPCECHEIDLSQRINESNGFGHGIAVMWDLEACPSSDKLVSVPSATCTSQLSRPAP